MEANLILYLAWGVGVVAVWGRVLYVELRQYLRLPNDERRRSPQTYERLSHYKARAFRDLISDFALFLVALASFASLLAFVYAQGVPGARGFLVALALGAFLGAGLVRTK